MSTALSKLLADMDALAELVSHGEAPMSAGRTLGMSKERTKRVWRQIKSRLGRQAI